jgi:hypothetical protein
VIHACTLRGRSRHSGTLAPAGGSELLDLLSELVASDDPGIGHVFLEDMDDESSPERSTDEFEFVNGVRVHLPVAHHIARTMLRNDFKRGGLAHLALAKERRGIGGPEGGKV